MLFPTHEAPRSPGPIHIGYILTGAGSRVIVAYTTSQPWPTGVPLPHGARFFTIAEAADLNQSRAFVMRLDILANLPLTAAWFPDLGHASPGIIAIAPPALQDELVRIATTLATRRRELIQMRGG